MLEAVGHYDTWAARTVNVGFRPKVVFFYGHTPANHSTDTTAGWAVGAAAADQVCAGADTSTSPTNQRSLGGEGHVSASGSLRMTVATISDTGFTLAVPDGIPTQPAYFDYLALGGDDLSVASIPLPSLAAGSHAVGIGFEPVAAICIWQSAANNENVELGQGFLVGPDDGRASTYLSRASAAILADDEPFVSNSRSGTTLMVTDSRFEGEQLVWESLGPIPSSFVGWALVFGGVLADRINGAGTVFDGLSVTPEAMIGTSHSTTPNNQTRALAAGGSARRQLWRPPSGSTPPAVPSGYSPGFSDENVNALGANIANALVLATLPTITTISGITAGAVTSPVPGIYVGWSSPSRGGFTLRTYTVYRRVSGTTEWHRVHSSAARGWTDYAVGSGVVYEYAVTWTGGLSAFMFESSRQSSPTAASVTFAGAYFHTPDASRHVEILIEQIAQTPKQTIATHKVRGRPAPVGYVGEAHATSYRLHLAIAAIDDVDRWDAIAAAHEAQVSGGDVYIFRREATAHHVLITRLSRRRAAGKAQRYQMELQQVAAPGG